MPNHFHGIIRIVGAPLVGAPDAAGALRGAATRGAPTLGEMVGTFKSISTDEYIRGVRAQGWPRFSGKLWQRNFYEHIIRNEVELERIRAHIRRNPQRWEIDRCNPECAVPVIDGGDRVVPWDES